MGLDVASVYLSPKFLQNEAYTPPEGYDYTILSEDGFAVSYTHLTLPTKA